MRSITKLRNDLSLLKRAGLVLLTLIATTLVFVDSIDNEAPIAIQFLFWLILLAVVLALWLYFSCLQAIERMGQLRRDYLNLLETHHHLTSLATDQQVLENLIFTPEGILGTLVENLDPKRKEVVTRLAIKRIKELTEWLAAHPDMSSENPDSDDGQLWLEFKQQKAGLEDLLKATKK